MPMINNHLQLCLAAIISDSVLLPESFTPEISRRLPLRHPLHGILQRPLTRPVSAERLRFKTYRRGCAMHICNLEIGKSDKREEEAARNPEVLRQHYSTTAH